jgi:DNA-binding CsgD family transcriptional regulator
MTESLSSAEMAGVLALIEEAHLATSAYEFRQTLIHGVGALIDSHSCVWTEFPTDVFTAKPKPTSMAEITDDTLDTNALLPIFNAYASQHPVIVHTIENHKHPGNIEPMAISDLLDRDQYQELDLYKQFYFHQSVEDQMSIGYIENKFVKGLSAHREFWGFTDKEHRLLAQIAACTFPYYRTLCVVDVKDTKTPATIQINDCSFIEHHRKLGITKRQAELLTHVARGKSNKQIADLCSVSEGTVRKHLENCFRRLSVNNRVSAITTAMEII